MWKKTLTGENMQTITKKQIILNIAQKNKMNPKDIQLVLHDFFDYMTENLSKGSRFEFRDFGIFELVNRKEKIGRNPKKPNSPIVIPARNAVKFTPGKKIKALVE